MYESDDIEIEPGTTGIRVLYTLLFLVIGRVVETVLLTVIAFEILFSLITRTPPSEGVRRFANRVLAYFYRIGRYLTYNEPDPPFPFRDLPQEVEPPEPLLAEGRDED